MRRHLLLLRALLVLACLLRVQAQSRYTAEGGKCYEWHTDAATFGDAQAVASAHTCCGVKGLVLLGRASSDSHQFQ
eukprot:m.149480 g.149480  ORF g.149480 m.149480 type:complete len:76 (+) comp52773_c1_seq2:186-413(+)